MHNPVIMYAVSHTDSGRVSIRTAPHMRQDGAFNKFIAAAGAVSLIRRLDISGGSLNMPARGNDTYSVMKRKNRPFIRFRMKVVVIIIILTFASCFAIYMAEANMNSKIMNSVGFSADSSVLSSSSPEEATEPEENKSSKIINPVPASDPLTETYFGKCAFVGDSISVGLSDFQLVPVRNVFAELGMNLEKINTEKMKTAYGEVTVIEALKIAKPENLYIMLGSNGISWLKIKDMINYYSQFIDEINKILPDAMIYVLSIPPVTAERETAAEEPIQNSDIDDYNSELLKMANEKQLYYVDINTALKGNDGKFPSDKAEKDGMHFKKTTYSIMLDYILSHTVKKPSAVNGAGQSEAIEITESTENTGSSGSAESEESSDDEETEQ